MKGITHVGGAMAHSSDIPYSDVPSAISNHTNPYEISNEEVRKRRTAREDREDITSAFGSY